MKAKKRKKKGEHKERRKSTRKMKRKHAGRKRKESGMLGRVMRADQEKEGKGDKEADGTSEPLVSNISKSKSIEFHLCLCGSKGSEKCELIKLYLPQVYFGTHTLSCIFQFMILIINMKRQNKPLHISREPSWPKHLEKE